MNCKTMGLDKQRVKRLLVRSPNWIGDAVMCEPACGALRRLFPAAEITLLAKPSIAELLQGNPSFDRILTYENTGRHAGITGKWALASRLRRENFHLAVLFQNAFEAALLVFLAGIASRYGYATDARGLLLTQAVPVPERSRLGHQVQYYLDLLRPLGPLEAACPPRLYVSEHEEHEALRRLEAAGVHPEEFLVGLNPGSVYGSAKRWLPERFAQAADRLLETCRSMIGRSGRVVIVGGRGEESLGRAVAAQMHHEAVVLTGRTSIRELMAVIKRCGLFLTNDTGPMHIAAAFDVPLVAVYGPTDMRTTSPYGEGHALVRHEVDCSPCLLRECPIDHRCMTGVTVDMVVEAALAQLGTMNDERGTMNQEAEGPKPDLSVPRSALIAPRSTLEGITVFLDRDGTMNRDTGFVKTPEELELFPGVVEAVSRLKRAGARVVVVTNQSGVARGLITSAALEAVHTKLRNLLAEGDTSLDAIYFCPHHPDKDCACRKPKTAMVERAAVQLGLDPSGYYVVGDQRRDIELGYRIGARTILVTTGPTSHEHLAALQLEGHPPDCVAESLEEGVQWILADTRNRRRPSDEPERHTIGPLQST